MAERDSNILMMYRGAPEERKRALSSGPSAVKHFLEQFEGDELIGGALAIVNEAAATIREAHVEDMTTVSYAKETANPGVLRDLAENVDELRWIAGVAGVAEYICNPVVPEPES